MKTLLTLLLATLCAATGYGQTIRSLGYNATNGQVVYSGTNTLTFTNNIGFSSGRIEIGGGLGFWDAVDGTYALFFQEDDPVLLNSDWNDPSVRSALGLPLLALTNTNAANFRSDINLGWSGLTNTNASGFRSALELSAGWLTNTNVTNFRTAIGLGATNTAVFQTVEAPSGLVVGDITVNGAGISGYGGYISFEEGFLALNGGASDWNFEGSGISQSGIISFLNTTNAAVTRTNVGLPLPALTNTSNDNFRSAIGLPWSGLTNTNRNTFRIALELEGTNAIPVQRAYELYDGANEAVALSAGDADLVAGPYLIITNAPTNTTNAVRWIQVIQGTNFYKLPLYQ